MRQFLISLLLIAASLTASAQTSINRIWRVNDEVLITDSAGVATPRKYKASSVEVRVLGGSFIRISSGGYSRTFLPTRFLNQSGTPWGGTVASAITAFYSNGSGGSGGSAFSGSAGELTSGQIPAARYGPTVVQTTGSYTNPAWLTALDPAKITWGASITYVTVGQKLAWDAKQSAITFTTNGTSGAATFSNNTINVPNYSGVTGGNGADGKTILSGTGIPSAGQGTDGDFYYRTTNSQFYGPKTSGAWGSGISLIGATGNNGPPGTDGTNGTNGKTILSGSSNPTSGQGVDGDFFINITSTTLFGPKAGGAWPTGVSLIGPAGSGGGGSTTLANNLTTVSSGNAALDAAQGPTIAAQLKLIKRLARSAGTAILGTGRFSAPNQNAYAGTETDLTYGYNFTPNVYGTGLRFSWPNWTLWVSGAPLEAAGLNPLTIEASVSNGTATQQITWDGSTTVTIAPGATLINDPLPLPLFPTATANLRVHVIKGASDKVVVGTQTNQFSTTDAVPSGTMTTTVVAGYAPLELMIKPTATPAKESVALVFDSQGIGVEGSEMGWIRAGLDAQGIPWARYAVGSSVIGTFDNNNTAFVLNQVAKYKVIITDIGNNNSFSWTTVAQAQAALTAWWTKLAALNGADLWVTTISPSTAANSTQITLRGQLNDWIRLQGTAPTLFRADGVTPLVTGVYDVGGITETPQFSNSCVPCSGCTSDGTHLSITGVNLAKTLVTSTSHLKEN
ncbi:hypothetical protein [Spirosoma areae]